MTKLGMNKDDQKRSNRGLVLKLIATGKCSSRVDLARETGLTKTAISHIVNAGIEKKMFVETSVQATPEHGRNPIGLAISPEMPKIMGILIQRGFTEAVLCDVQLNILRLEKSEKECRTAQELVEEVFRLADRIMEGDEKIIGIGCASIGPVNVTEGLIVAPLHFNGIRNVPIRRLLEERYHVPVCFDHDNQSAALAEFYYGNGKGYEDVLLVSVGKGVGCGVVVDGHRIHSFTGFAPEIGHVSIDRHGKLCKCGNRGCVETCINSIDVRNRMRKRTGLDLTYREFCQRTDLPGVRTVLEEVSDDLVQALLNTLNILNSQTILLCMDCIYWPEEYIERIEHLVNEKKFGNRGIQIPVRKVKFLDKAQVLGAAANVVSRLFSGELLEDELVSQKQSF